MLRNLSRAFLTLTLSLYFDFEDNLSLDENGLRHSTAVVHAIAQTGFTKRPWYIVGCTRFGYSMVMMRV